jgi:hypothetical protein
LEQANAMAAKDMLDHEVLGSFSSRIAPARSGCAAENIAYGYDNFERALDQWIASTGHRKQSLAVQHFSRRCRQRNRRYFSSHVLGNGDRRQISAAADSCKQEDAACNKKKIACTILPSENSRYLV